MVSSTGKTVEEPVKKDDHGLDALRYMVMYLDDPSRVDLGHLDDSLAQTLRNYTGY